MMYFALFSVGILGAMLNLVIKNGSPYSYILGYFVGTIAMVVLNVFD